MNDNGRTRVFVYGTLLSGEPNHHLLDRDDLVPKQRANPSLSWSAWARSRRWWQAAIRPCVVRSTLWTAGH